MPRQRSPSRDKAKELYINSKGKKPLKDIATELDLKDTQVRKWKSQDKWDEELKGNVTNRKRNVTKQDKGVEGHSKSELTQSEIETLANEDLTEKQRLFCVYYSKSFNATSAYRKAYECDYQTSLTNGSRLLGNARIKDEIMHLKQERYSRELLTVNDIFQKYMDIAFADISDFLEFDQEDAETVRGDFIKVNRVWFKRSSEVDGTLIGEVKQGKDGASIKLPDRMKALDWLANHMDMATSEQRAKIDLLKVQVKKLETETGNNNQTEQVVIINDV